MTQSAHSSDLPATGVSLSRTEGLGQYYDASGRRSVVIGVEGGDSEVWIYPLKAAYELKFAVEAQGQFAALREFIRSFEVAPEASTARFETPSGALDQRILTPVDRPLALFAFRSTAPLRLKASFKSDIKLMWPADTMDQAPEVSVDGSTGAWAVASTVTGDAALIGWGGGEKAAAGEDGIFEQTVVLEPGVWSVFAVAASCEGIDDARGQFADGVDGLPRLYAEAVEYYREFLDSTATIESSDPSLDTAFLWAKIGVEKSYMETPGMGGGYIAGFAPSWGGGRPGFGWYFGRDSSWTGFGANDYGDFAKVRENIRLLAKYQIPDGPNSGKIYHELSAADDRLQDHNYCFVAGDATPFFVVDIANYYAWTADAAFVREMWPHVKLAMDWCRRMDVDGDLLIDNPPAGHQWYDYGEKNMIDLVAIWAMALDGAARLADVMGDSSAAAWREQSAEVVRILNEDFWNEEEGYLHDRKLPDGSMSSLTTANPTVPLLWGLIEPDKAGRAIRRMGQNDLTIPWGMRTNSNLDDIYRPDGYHEGTVWPLTTGWASLAAFANGDPELGWHHLKANADLTLDWDLGYITEVLGGDEREPSGSPHQAWSEAMVVMPVVEGILGIVPDWPARTISVAPQLPDALSFLALRNLSLGDARMDIEARRTSSSLSLRVAPRDADIAVVFAPFVPAGKTVGRVALGGRELLAGHYALQASGSRWRVLIRAEARGAAGLNLEIEWRDLEPGEQCAV